MYKKILEKISENKQIFWFFGFLLKGIIYFSNQFFPLCYHTVHLKADDCIPFVPVFIIPYLLWYIYVPLPMIYQCFTAKKAFVKQAVSMFPLMIIICVFFCMYPTNIDFRPSAEGSGVLLWLCRFVFFSDKPVNVFPSLHCFEALTVHLTTFVFGSLKTNKSLRIVSFFFMVIICLSTVFIKQHSIADLVAGCLLAFISCFSVQLLFNYFEKRKRDNEDKSF